MTITDAITLFRSGTLSFNDTKVTLDGKGNYNVVKNEIRETGTYEFVQSNGKVFLRTEPAIIENKRDLEIEIYLAGHPVKMLK